MFLKSGLATLLVVLLTGQRAFSEDSLRLPALFSNHMCVQADRELRCWGWAGAGNSVTVDFLDAQNAVVSSAKATAGSDGLWQVELPPLASGTRGSMKIRSSEGGEKIIFDVLAGEVWLAAGQSNMRWPLGSNSRATEILAALNEPDIRLFLVDMQISDETRPDVGGSWMLASRESAEKFSAVAWFFGSFLRAETKKPVGLIQAAWGGTPIVTWLAPQVAAKFPESAQWETAYQKELKDSGAVLQRYQEKLEAWKAANSTKELQEQNASSQPKAPRTLRPQNRPSRCYNAMVNGLMPYSLRGIIWYQGESDTGAPEPYKKFFPALISSWREQLKNPEAPFFYVELPAYNPPKPPAISDGWARLRESQASALLLPHTGVATAIDLGNPGVLHPKNKQPIAERLARLALTEVYGREGQSKSPQFASASVESGKMKITLDHADGLRSRTEKIDQFEVAGKDGVWKPAEALVSGTEVWVGSSEVPAPVAVRYAWANAPTVSLENKSGLPLRPFRTDQEKPKAAPAANAPEQD